MCKVVAYYRVSTAKQGQSGLGLEAQEKAVTDLCASRNWHMVASFTEVESGKRNTRPVLQQALQRAKLSRSTLVIAKLDRLSRNAAFLLTLRDSGVKFIAADNPDVNELAVGVLAVVAEAERKQISERTREALKAAKARGRKLGNPNGAAALRRAGKGNAASLEVIRENADRFASDMAPIIHHLRLRGVTSLEGMARALNADGYHTARGGKWYASSVRLLLTRLEGMAA